MTCEFVGRSLTEGKKTFHSISTDNVSFVEAGMSMFSCDDIFEKFAKLKEKGSTKIFSGDPSFDSALAMAFQPNALEQAAISVLDEGRVLDLSQMEPPLGSSETEPVFMQFDVARQAYVTRRWDSDDEIYSFLFDKACSSGTTLHPDQRDFLGVEAAAFVAEQYNLGYLDVNANDDDDTAKYKTLGRLFINSIQTSLSGCLQWRRKFNFVFGEDGTNNEICIKEEMTNFEMRIFDNLSPKRDKKKLVLKGVPTFNFIPSHAWGTKYAGNVPEPGPPGHYPAPEIGGEDNPKNQVTAELDVYYNANTGKAEAGTRQILARLLDDIPAVKINNVAANIDELTVDQLMNEVNNKLNYFSTGYAMPVNVHKGNPYMFGPTFSNKGKGCTDEKKEKILVTNRSQKSYEKGRIVLLQRIDDEWIPMDFGEDDPVSFSKTGNWNFQYLIADKDSYFKDDRHYYEEQFQPELDGSITPAQYESLFRFHFYSTLVDAINFVNVPTWDQANDPFGVNGQVTLASTTSYPSSPCSTQGTGTVVTGNGQLAHRIEANNGVWEKVETSTTAASGCFTPSSNCSGGQSSIADTMPPHTDPVTGQPNATFDTDFIAWLISNEPDGLDPTTSDYNGEFVVDEIGSSNFTQNTYPTAVYTKMTPIPVPSRFANLVPGGMYTPYGQKVGPTPDNIGPVKNVFNCTVGCLETQEQRKFVQSQGPIGPQTTFERRISCVATGYGLGYLKAFSIALFNKLNSSCAAEADAAPQVKTFEYQKATNARKFVGSRRYLNVTSFDMLSSHWNGNNYADWLGTTNPSFGDDGSQVDAPNEQLFWNFHPFWGALFTDGYTEESVKTFMANRQGGQYSSIACSNHNTGTGDEDERFGFGYLSNRDGRQSPTSTNVTSYARKTGSIAYSLDYLFTNGDINLAHLPADIGTNAAHGSGLYGTPILDFRRMVNLVNVVVPGTGYDPVMLAEEPSATEAANTVDWGNNKGANAVSPLALNTKIYFSETKYKLNDGNEFSIPDRAAWVSRMPVSYDGSNVICENGNTLGGNIISKHSLDSFYDLEPASAKITFMPLTAEWIGAYDRFDSTYQPATGHRAAHQPWPVIAYDGLNAPVQPTTSGAGWYWDDDTGTSTYLNNKTVQRLSLYPGDVIYTSKQDPKNGSTLSLHANTTQVFPEVGYVEKWNYQGSTYGGRRGDPIFRIGRNNSPQFKAIGMATTYQGPGPNEEMGGPVNPGQSQFLDYEFIETENPGDKLIPLYPSSGGVTSNDPNHGLIGAMGQDHTVELVPGFPFDGYVRHRTDDYSVFGPRDCWQTSDETDSADCVGIITARATIGTNLTNLVCTLEQTRGLPTYTPNTQGQEFGQWGAKNQNIQNVGSEMLFARVFEAWPDDQTLFDARYFAVMHFNPGQLITAAEIEDFEYAGVEYKRYKTDSEVDIRVPTLKGIDLDATTWLEVPIKSKISSDGAKPDGASQYEELAPYDLWRVSTVRRGMLLPFTYTVPTIGIDAASIVAVNNLNGNPEMGTGFSVGDTLTFQGGSGSGAQIRVTEIVIDTGAIVSFELIDNGKDYVPGDFVSKSWSNDQTDAGFSAPQIIAVPDAGVSGKGAYIVAPFGAMYLKDETDEAPQTAQNSPVKLSKSSPKEEEAAIGRDDNNGSSVALPLYGADGNSTKFYDVFMHYHNDITSTIAWNKHDKVSRGLLKGLAKVQYMKLELSTR